MIIVLTVLFVDYRANELLINAAVVEVAQLSENYKIT